MTTPTRSRHSGTDSEDAAQERRARPVSTRSFRSILIPLIAGLIVLGLIGAYTTRALIKATGATLALPAAATDDSGAAVNYSSSWLAERGSGFGQGTAHGSSKRGAALTYRFSGSQAMVYGAVGPSSGIAHVSVDDGPAYEVDFYSPEAAGARLLWVSSPLIGEHHRLRLVVTAQHRAVSTGNGVDVDGFGAVASGFTLAPDDPGVTFSGSSAAGAGGATRTVTGGGSVNIRFSGRAAVVIGSLAKGTRATVAIDGEVRQPVSAESDRLWSSGELRSGRHRIAMQVVKGALVLDQTRVYQRVASMPVATTGAGTGNGWRTYTGNPVVGKNWGTAFDLAAVYQNGLYRMWFSWRPKSAIAYVQSVDGISWTVPRIVFSPRAGSWETDVNRPAVLVGADGSYDMWYTGQDGTGSAIGLATSHDGIHWSRARDTPVLTATGWEQPSVMNASVTYDTSTRTYKMWYSGGQTQEPNAIGYATSVDGRSWKRYSSEPVLQRDPAHVWEQDRVAGVQVIQQAPNEYLAFYIGYKDILSGSIGVARSSDGVHWMRSHATPLISAVPASWDCDSVYKPFAIWDRAHQQWKMWFNGRCGYLEQLGLAVHDGADLG